MLNVNFFIQSLLEADNTNANAAGEGTDDNATEDAGGNDPNAAEDQTDTANQNQDDKQTEDQNKEENQDDNKGEEEQDDGLGDDFDLDPDGGDDAGEGDDTPPDGLTSPDDDGSGDNQDEVETNVQTNILKLSKLDRTLAKRRLFTNFQDLRTQVNTFRNIIANNEENIEAEIREKIYEDIDKAYSSITDYMTYKFSFINYEENLQAYLLFSKMMQDIVNYTSTNATKSGKKSKLVKDAE